MDAQAVLAKLLQRVEELEAQVARIPELEAKARRVDELEERLRHVEAYRARLVRDNESLREETTILKNKVRELTARINQDSSNSSKAPSSDKPWKDRRPSKPTGKSPGGQPGHEGKTREPFPPEQVDLRVPVVPEKCSGCAHELASKDFTGKTLPHQVVEIPPVVAQVTEYVLYEAICPGCGGTTMAMLPDGVPATCVGPRFQAILCS